jgi:hypothetical protein
MKKIFFILIFSAGFFSQAVAQRSNLDSTIHKIFVAIKNKDEQAFLEFFPTRSQFIGMVQLLLGDVAKDAHTDSLLNAEWGFDEASFSKKMGTKFLRSFRGLIIRAEEKHIDLSKLVLNSYILDSTKENGGVVVVNGIMTVSAPDTLYRIKFENITWMPTDQMWVGISLRGIFDIGEEAGNTIDRVKMKLLKIERTDSLAPPPPPPPKKTDQKSKTKTRP